MSLVRCAVNAQLICAFVFAKAKIRSSHYEARLVSYCTYVEKSESIVQVALAQPEMLICCSFTKA